MRQECGAACPNHTARITGSRVAWCQEHHNLEDRGRSGHPPKMPHEPSTCLGRIVMEGKGDGRSLFNIMEAASSDNQEEEQVVQAP